MLRPLANWIQRIAMDEAWLCPRGKHYFHLKGFVEVQRLARLW